MRIESNAMLTIPQSNSSLPHGENYTGISQNNSPLHYQISN